MNQTNIVDMTTEETYNPPTPNMIAIIIMDYPDPENEAQFAEVIV